MTTAGACRAPTMDKLGPRALAYALFSAQVMGLCCFLPASTLRFGQAWVFLGLYNGGVLAIFGYLWVRDPRLLERRIRADRVTRRQRRENVLQAVAWMLLLIVSSLDHRWGWSSVPAWCTGAGDGLVALSLLATFQVFRANVFASASIEVMPGQILVATGPYARVRHPMYAAVLLGFLGVPPALGSAWGLLMVLPLLMTIVVRVLDEERFLASALEGYTSYMEQTKYRLLPGVW